MCLQLTLKAIQLLARSPDLPPDKSRDLAPLVDGAARGSALRALRSRDAHLVDLLLLDGDAAPAAAPAHQGRGAARETRKTTLSQMNLPQPIIISKELESRL